MFVYFPLCPIQAKTSKKFSPHFITYYKNCQKPTVSFFLWQFDVVRAMIWKGVSEIAWFRKMMVRKVRSKNCYLKYINKLLITNTGTNSYFYPAVTIAKSYSWWDKTALCPIIHYCRELLSILYLLYADVNHIWILGTVLLDENLLRVSCESPLYVNQLDKVCLFLTAGMPL